MRLNNVVKFKNNIIRDYCNRNSVVVDATMGNGNDTLFLSKICKNGMVHAFDVQDLAIENTKQRCAGQSNIKYYLKSHAKFITLGLKEIDFAIFNLGYLPGSDLEISTNYQSTILGIEQMLEVLKVNGAICITLYTGHDKGVEAVGLLNFISKLSNNYYAILKYEFLNLDNAPYVIVIEKLKK